MAATGEVSRRVDDIQYETGEGPCLEAIDGDDVTRAADLATDRQWPQFAASMVDLYASVAGRSAESLALRPDPRTDVARAFPASALGLR